MPRLIITPIAERLLNSAPGAGDGLHRWLISGANECQKFGLDPEVGAYTAIADTVIARGGEVIEREIRKAIRKAYSQPLTNGTYKPAPTWPNAGLELIERVTEGARGALSKLQGMSPENPDQPTYEIISQLFPPDSIISAGMTEESTNAFELQKVRDRLHRFQYIVPSPMSAKVGLTQEGKESGRCLGNTGPRRFLVTEFDFKRTNKQGGPTRWIPLIDLWQANGATVQDACAAIILHLKQYGPLVMAVFSGNASLHAWWYCEGEPEHEGSRLNKFMRYAATLGADTATYTRSQFVRNPGATRPDGRKQTTHYLNTELTKTQKLNTGVEKHE